MGWLQQHVGSVKSILSLSADKTTSRSPTKTTQEARVNYPMARDSSCLSSSFWHYGKAFAMALVPLDFCNENNVGVMTPSQMMDIFCKRKENFHWTAVKTEFGVRPLQIVFLSMYRQISPGFCQCFVTAPLRLGECSTSQPPPTFCWMQDGVSSWSTRKPQRNGYIKQNSGMIWKLTEEKMSL